MFRYPPITVIYHPAKYGDSVRWVIPSVMSVSWPITVHFSLSNALSNPEVRLHLFEEGIAARRLMVNYYPPDEEKNIAGFYCLTYEASPDVS